MTDQTILEALETLAKALPWDTVSIWAEREPEGKIKFTAYVSPNGDFAFSSLCAFGETPMEAANKAIKDGSTRDPEICKQQAIADLEDKLAKLRAVIVGPPPYRPGTQIPQTVDV